MSACTGGAGRRPTASSPALGSSLARTNTELNADQAHSNKSGANPIDPFIGSSQDIGGKGKIRRYYSDG